MECKHIKILMGIVIILCLLFLIGKFWIYQPIYTKGYHQGGRDTARGIIDKVRDLGDVRIVINHQGEYDYESCYDYYDPCQKKPDYCSFWDFNSNLITFGDLNLEKEE